jgi:hypothetical protein
MKEKSKTHALRKVYCVYVKYYKKKWKSKEVENHVDKVWGGVIHYKLFLIKYSSVLKNLNS